MVCWRPNHQRTDVVPPDFDVGSRVHQDGGGAYLPADTGNRNGHTLFVSSLNDDRLYRLEPGQAPRPITPSPPASGALRYADLRLTPDRRWLMCVRERYDPDGSQEATVNELVALPADGSAEPLTLASGHDFYAAPRPSPDGSRLAWVTWDRPRMPWDGSDLLVAELSSDGQLGDVRHLAGGPAESIVQPEWTADGALLFVSDRTGWWNLYWYHSELAASRGAAGHVAPLLPLEAEFADAPWELDYASYGNRLPLSPGRRRPPGRARPAASTPPAAHPVVHVHIGQAVPARRRRSARIPRRQPDHQPGRRDPGVGKRPRPGAGRRRLLDPGRLPGDAPADRCPGRRRRLCPRPLLPPTNQDATGPPERRPPLLVHVHPGPTADAKARLELRVQFLTSRGFAVLDVDDGGSTGYGRADRERLTGQWGVVDVDDCLRATRQLVTSGQVDPDRIAIVGASAGGYTALRALATSDLFATGVSYHGIADLETFRMQAPKYRAHQLDRLIGPYPDAAEVYRTRSPLQLAGLIRRPVLGLHRAADPVVPAMQAEAMARALQRRGVPHRLLVVAAEGTGSDGKQPSARRSKQREPSTRKCSVSNLGGKPRGLQKATPPTALASRAPRMWGCPVRNL